MGFLETRSCLCTGKQTEILWRGVREKKCFSEVEGLKRQRRLKGKQCFQSQERMCRNRDGSGGIREFHLKSAWVSLGS